jgi:gas vesicle protein
MGKFLLGLIIGIIVAGLAMTMNPHLPQELRASLASLTAQVMRSAGETADDLGNAAEEAAGRVERPADREPPAAPAPTAPAPAEPAGPANQGQTDQPR